MKRFGFKSLRNSLLIGLFLLGGIATAYGATDLTVTVPAGAVEGDGLLAAAGTVTCSEAPSSDLTVELSSDDASEILVPATVTVPAGQVSAAFDLTIVDDSEIDGTQTVIITASATGWNSGTENIGVQDNEPKDLTVVIPANAGEGDGVLGLAGTVSTSGMLVSDLVVDLTSSDTSEVTAPATVTISSGQSSATFDLTVIDDADLDGTQTVTVTAAATGWTSGKAEMDIEDNENPDHFTEDFSSIPDISNQTLTFTPDGSGNFYSVCRETAANFVIDSAAGTIISLDDDDYLHVTLAGGAQVSLYGVSYSSFYIGSNGYLTFGAGDDNYYDELFDDHFNLPRISGLFSDLDPSDGGTISWQQLIDRIVVTFEDVPEYGSSNSNNFQMEIFFNGVIRLTHLSLEAEYGAAGLSAGTGMPTAFLESDLSAYGDCLSFSIPSSAIENEGVLSGQGTLTISAPLTTDLEFSLVSDDTSEITLPAIATISAGQTSVSFDVTVVDDILLDGTQTVTITALAPGQGLQVGTIQVHDSETALLTVIIPGSAAEGNGSLSGQGTVSVNPAVESDVTVWLSSDDPGEVMVPETVAFSAGQTSAVFDLTIIDDTEIDGLQTATITAAVPGWTAGSGAIAVADNETTTLTIVLPPVAAEGDGVLVDAARVDIPGTFGSDLVIDLALSDVSEFRVPATLTIPAGQTTAAFDIEVIDDGQIDGTQTVALTASAAGWTPDTASIEIADNDPGELQFDSEYYTVNENSAGIVITVVRTSSSSGTISVDYELSEATATSGSDYTPASGTLNFGDGEVEKTFFVAILDDADYEGDETLDLLLGNPGGGAALGYPVTAQLTIIDHENPSIPYFQDFSTGLPDLGWEYYSSNSYGRIRMIDGRILMDSSVNGNYVLNEAILTINMEGFSNIQLSFLQAEFGDEVTALPATFSGHRNGDGVAVSNDGLTWYTIVNASQLDVGASPASFTLDLDSEVAEIQANFDPTFDYTPEFKVKFQQYDNYQYATDGRAWDDASVTGTSTLRLMIPAAVNEGDGLLTGVATVRLDSAPNVDVAVVLTSGNLSEIALPPLVTIPAGQTEAGFDLTVLDDGLVDGSQSVAITASSSDYGSATGQIIVHDNETANLLLVLPAHATEGDGVLTGQATVHCDAVVAADVVIGLSVDDTSEVTVPETVTIPAGQASAVFDMTIVDDTEIDGPQPVTVTAAVTNWTSASSTLEVADNETMELAVNLPAGATEGDGTLAGAGTVSLTGIYPADVLVDLSSDDVSEVTLPATMTIAAGQTSAAFDLTIVDDGDIDGLRTVSVTASADGWSSGSATIAVADNDPGGLQFAADTFSVNETDGSAVITVVRTTSSSGSIAVDYATGDGSASAGSDYMSVSGTLVFDDGQTQASFTIPIIDDSQIEPNESVQLSLSNPAGGASLNIPHTAVLTILENDFPFLPYYQDFAEGLPAIGWDLYSSNNYGRIEVVNEKLRMDTSTGDLTGNEAVLSLNTSGFYNLQLSFFQAEFGDELHALPDRFTGHADGDGVAISNDGITWYTIFNAAILDVGAAGQIYTTDLASEVAEIQVNYDAAFNLDSNLRIKFQQYDNSAYSSDGRAWDDISVTGTAYISVAIPAAASEGDGELTGQGTVSVARIPTGDLTVSLISDNPAEVMVAPAVTILAGRSSAVFDLTIVDDGFFDGTQTTSMTASAMGFGYDQATIQVHDNEIATLLVDIPEVAGEAGGVLAGQGIVSVGTAVDRDVTVFLTSDDLTEMTVPDTVTIPSGQTSAVFDLTIVDDSEIDGLQTVTVSAAVVNWTTGYGSIEIEDNEAMDLTITLPATGSEGEGLMVGAGSVSIAGTYAVDLLVDLASDDTATLTVPATVTLPAGQTSAAFDITAIDDDVVETTRTVTISASASGWTPDSAVIVIFDNELIHITGTDNENNSGTGVPDNDMDRTSPPCVYKTDSIHPIEFNIDVTGPPPVSSAYLSVFIEDIDWPAEVDEVIFNGHSLGYAIGENQLNYSTLFVIPDLSWIQPGDNLVQVFVDRNTSGNWCARVQGGQLIFDDGIGAGTAIIRSAESDRLAYEYGQTVRIGLEVDTALANQNVRLELVLRDPTGQLIDFDTSSAARNWTLNGTNDEPYQWPFTLPNSGNDGLWAVSISVYDIATQRFENRQVVNFPVPVGAALIPSVVTVTPVSGPALAATPLVIIGSNFFEGETTCGVGGRPLENLTVVDNTTITGNVSAAVPVGSHDVACTTVYGTGTRPNAFTIIGPQISSSAVIHDFGEVNLQAAAAHTVTVTNSGSADLIIESLAVYGTHAADFAVSNDGCSGQTLAAQGACTFDAAFAPTVFGIRTASVAISSNDPFQPALAIAVAGTGVVDINMSAAVQSVVEDAAGVFVTAVLNTVSAEEISVPFTVAGTAVGGGTDHDLVTGSFIVPAGQTAATVDFNLQDDGLDEGDETVVITLGVPVNARLGAIGTQTVTIVDNDPPPTVAFTASSQTLNEGGGTVTVTANLGSVSGREVTVPFTVAGTAQGTGTDHNLGDGAITIAAGQTSGSLSFTVVDDDLDEADETVIIALGTPINAIPGATTIQTVTILDNDKSVELTAAAQSVDEDIGSVTVAASLSSAGSLDVTIPYTVSGSADGGGTDHDLAGGEIAIAAGQTGATITFSVTDDALDELDETIIVTLGTPLNARPGLVTSQTITIIDNDPTPVMNLESATQVAAEDAGTIAITATIDAASGLDVTIPYTVGGTADGRGTDHDLTGGAITIAAGQTSADLVFSVVDDALDEDDETVVVTLGTPVNAAAGSIISHTVTILDNDNRVQWTTDSRSAAEDVGSVTLTVTLNAAGSLEITVPYTVGGTAGLGTDHDLAADSITFAPGQISESVSFNVVNDNLDEIEETVIVTLGTPVNARLGAVAEQTVTLIDNDPPPVIELTAAGQTVPENIGAVTVTAGLSTVSGREVTVPYTVSGTADGGIDHNFAAGTITVAAGQTSGTAGFSVVDDSIPEADETVIVTLGMPGNASSGTVTVQTITIEDNDLPTVLAVAGNYPERLNAVDDFRLTIRFSSSMDTSLEPTIAMISSGSAQPVVPADGTWLADDTYLTPDIVLAPEMGGSIQVNISGARNSFGRQMLLAANVFQFVLDTSPPQLTATDPGDGALIQQANRIEFTLSDQLGVVDDAAVVASVAVLNGAGQSVDGTVSEANDHFTFTPAAAPLADGNYQVALTARDLEGNQRNFSFSFTVDSLPPVVPAITGQTVLSGLIRVRPALNHSRFTTITLSGSREDATSVYINSQKKINSGSGDWSSSLTLSQGSNTFEIWLQDGAGNRGPSVWLDILADSVAPVPTAITPADNSYVNAAPALVTLTYSEATSGLNTTNSILLVKDVNQAPVPGSWALSGPDTLVFTPAQPLVDMVYTVDIRLEDNFTNRSSSKQYRFAVDSAAPSVPVIRSVISPTYNPVQTIYGTKEAYGALLLNGQQIVGHTAQTTWSRSVDLDGGSNSFTFKVQDRAGNLSDPAVVDIVFDDIVPPPVSNLTVNGAGDGHTVSLNWSGYDDSGHGDVASFRVYRSSADFSSVSDAVLLTTVGQSQFSYTVNGLERGTVYWFAVVAVDRGGNAGSSVAAVSATPMDVVPPDNVTNLKADSSAAGLAFSWDPAAEVSADLAGYRVFFDNDTEGVVLAKDVTSYSREGLSGATGYSLTIKAFDHDTNHSSGIALIGVTLLPNPGNLTAETHSGYVDLSWDEVNSGQFVKHYAIYASQSDFSSVAGMTPSTIAVNTTGKVAGLTNGVTYYLAVTAVNDSGAEDKTVTTIAATPQADVQGPDISEVAVDGQALTDGHTLTQSATFSCAAHDPAGVSRVEFSIDGTLIQTDSSPVYSAFWNVVASTDDDHTLTIDAYDTLGNRSSLDVSLVVALDPPAAPVISQPAGGTLTKTQTLTVAGTAPKFSEVILYRNDTQVGTAIAVNPAGNFSTPLSLAEGDNLLAAEARNRAGTGPRSAAVLIELDTSLPVSPSNISAQAQTGGAVRLTWTAPSQTEVAGYNLYRAAASFIAWQEAVKINNSPVKGTAYSDLPPSDGLWHYRATTVDTAGNESDLSTEALATADSTNPRVLSIDYSPQGAFDPASNTMAPGTVNLVVTLSESLQSAPYLSIAPDGGIPISVQLHQDTDTTYSGFFVISDTTPGGTAYAIFSGRDGVGNRGTAIDAGGSIQIDTTGPAITRLAVSPPDPIQNDEQNPLTVTVVVGLNEALKSGSTPQLSYLLSGEGREAIDIDTLTEINAQPGDAQTWQAEFTLPADAGLAQAESFYFDYLGSDALGNINDSIRADNLFQVYQGDLPPLAPPLDLKAKSTAGGKIRLTWSGVAEAVGYQLYRQAPTQSELSVYERLDMVETFIDEPVVDGYYTYALASIRGENGQEAVSGLSQPVVAVSDSVAPAAPLNFDLELVANGIKAEWDPPQFTEAASYSLYRANTADITSVQGLTPLATGIAQTLVVDPTPSPSAHCYAVTAVDAVGNESPPSNSFYLNFQLLPVSGIQVLQIDDDPPQVSWTHPGGSIAGYDIYMGPDNNRVKLNPVLLTQRSYTDLGFSQDERRYTVIAVDNSNVPSLSRSIVLPRLAAELVEGSRIERGIMNRLDYVVLNKGQSRVDNIRLKVGVDAYQHTSETFSIDPGTSQTVSVVVGGYDDLAGLAALATTIEVTPGTNEAVNIVRNGFIEISDGTFVLQISNEEFIRAASGKVQFALQNTSEAEIEIVTAKNSGNSASDQVIFYLEDEDGNVLATKAFKQATGDKLVTLSNKNTVARIAAGDSFTSDLISMAVPANAPDNVTIRLNIAKVYYHQAQTTQVAMDGLSTTHPVTLIETSYYGDVLQIEPQTSTGDQDIVITGQAVERAGGDPMANVPLKLVITLDGFERTYDVYTGADGIFNHTFKPLKGESGVYRVRAVHPGLTDKPVHGQFVINKVAVTPAVLNLNVPKNYKQTINIRVQTGDGTSVDNLRLEYAAEDQPFGNKPSGVHLTPGPPVAQLGGKKTANLPFTIWADNTAGATEKLNLTVKSGETDPVNWGKVTINARFSEAKPSLHFTPNRVEAGMALDDTVTETVTLKNSGLADMYDLQLSLLNSDGTEAPNWVYLSTTTGIKNLAIGNTQQVGVTFAPTSAVPLADYTFKLRVKAANHATTDINLHAAVTQSGTGKILFKISDIYTGTYDQNGVLVEGLAGARVKLQNEETSSIEYNRNSDNIGEAYFENIPAGPYKCRITASNHQEYIGRVWIKPGVTSTEDVFLDYNLVTVEWSVTEITIEDKYDIILTAVYETNVPAAVVVIEPASVTLPAMKAGDVFNGEFTLTNYGLIRADDLNFSLPPDDQNFKYEILGGLPDSLEAKQRITVAYRVTSLKSLDNEDDGTATGGGCNSYRKCARATYKYDCANDVTTNGSATSCWTRSYGTCGGGAGPGGGTWSVGGGGVGRTVSKPAPKSKTIEGVECFPEPPRKEQDCGDDGCSGKETSGNRSQDTGSSVNLAMREYFRDKVDLAVKAPGGMIETRRRFYGNQWRWEHDRHKLSLQPAAIGSGIESIDKGGVVYEKSSIDAQIFINDIFRIVKTVTGYRWEDPEGGWIDYDANGNMIYQGSRTGVRVKLLYQDGKLSGVADRNDNQVLWYETDDDGLITAVRDSDNRRVEYGYTGGRLSTVKDVLGYETFFDYDGQGRLTEVTEPGGRVITVSYDKYNGVASVVDSQGAGFFFEYEFNEATQEQYARIVSSAGKVKEVWYDRDFETRRVDINGRTMQKIIKDGRNQLVTDEQGNVTRKNYDEWDNLTQVIYPDGSSVSYEYEHKYNKRIKETDENDGVTRYVYDGGGNLIRKIEAAGTEYERITEYTYDDDGNLLTTRRLADANTLEALTQLSYDAQGNLTSITDPEDGLTRFTSHDAMGSVLTKIDARGKQWDYEYDNAGQLKKIIDPLNNATEFFYDETGQKIKEVDANNNEKIFEYDERNNLTKVTDDLGNITRLEYDADGKLRKQIDPEEKTITYEYDLDGRLLKTIDGNGNQIAMEYADATGSGCSSCSAAGGASNQPSRITYPTFAKEFLYDKRGRKVIEKDVLSDTEIYLSDFEYDPAGNLIARADKEDKTTGYAYDVLNRLKTVTDPLAQDTAYFYDNRDNLTALTDATGNTTWFEYDRNNRLVKEIRSEGQQTTYQYDQAGNLTAKIDAKGQKTEYNYDDAARLEQIRYFTAADHDNAAKTVTFSYDSVGNLTGYNDGITSAVYTYDDLYRKLSETVNYGTFELASSYTYYKNGLKKTFSGPDGISYAYTYDNNNQLTGVDIPGAGYITYSSYKWNRPTEVVLPGGSLKQYDYDPLMRVKSITAKDPAQNYLLNYQYNYDRMDNITAKVTEHGEYGYGYDDLYRLTAADNPVQTDERFSYDAVGNRLTAGGVADDWNYNDNNELQGYAGVTFEFDDNGNMTQKADDGQDANYIYNIEDRLTEVWNGAVGSGSLIATYYYDPFGRRLWKEVGGVKTYFVYANEGLVAEVDAAGNVVKSYGYRPDSTWTTDPLFMKVGGQYYFYQNDHLGTPQKLTAVNGAVVWSAKYSSFGEASVDPFSTVVNNQRYAGQYFDAETGLHYNYHRYYCPTTGRYLRTDPIRQFGWLNNNYSYVYGNPVGYIDPAGLFSCLPNGHADPKGKPSSPAEGAAAWAQYQFEQGNKDYTYAADNPGAGGKNQWKCNSFVRDSLTEGGGLDSSQLPKHYHMGKKGPYFATANEIADPNKNTDVLSEGDGSTGDLVAWASDSGSGHTGIVGCDGKIYSATKEEISQWNNGTWTSWNQITRYEITGRKKVYRRLN